MRGVRLIQWRKAHAQGALGHAIAGGESFAIKACGCQQFSKVIQRLRSDHLSANPGNAPVTEIIAGNVFLAHPACTQVIAERGRKGDSGFGLSHQIQPLARAYCKLASIQVVHRKLTGNWCQYKADQTHVVIKRQPGHQSISGGDIQTVLNDTTQVGHNSVMLDDYAARKTRAARGVLNVRNILCFNGGQRQIGIGQGVKCLGQIDHFSFQFLSGFLEEWQIAFGGDSNYCRAGFQQAM